ncbi:hypothetical protein BJF79_13130 [Actinomadura sp. CNU-125]|nr:hypothetical protein BJF79_13130 [Actinomadura sp. CNU-125]
MFTAVTASNVPSPNGSRAASPRTAGPGWARSSSADASRPTSRNGGEPGSAPFSAPSPQPTSRTRDGAAARSFAAT